MKRKLLSLLIAGLSVTAAATATAGAPTVYGKVNVTLQSFDLEQINRSTGVVETQQDDWRMMSNASRLGVKGDWDINNSLKAIYKLEYEVSVDSNDTTFSTRNIAGGFQGGWGTMLAGRHDTPLKLIQEKVDRFNDLQIGDIAYYMIGEYRRNNMVMYTTPSMSGFAFTAAFAPGESAQRTADGKTQDGFADTTSFALTYGAGTNLYLAAAHEQNMAGNSSFGSADITRLVGEVVFGPAKVGALYQTAEGSDRIDVLPSVSSIGSVNQLSDFGNSTAGTGNGSYKEQDAWMLSAEFAATKEFILKAQYGYSESTPVAAGLDDTEATMIAFGADYKLDKNAKLFGYYAQLEVEGQRTGLANVGKPKDSTIGVGFELNF
jgi:predicted porin